MKFTCELIDHWANHLRFVGLLMDLKMYLWPFTRPFSWKHYVGLKQCLPPFFKTPTSILTVVKTGYFGILPALSILMVLRDKMGSAFAVHEPLLSCEALLFQLLLSSCQVSEAQLISPVELALSFASTLRTAEVLPSGCLPHSCCTKVKQS